MRRCLVLLLWCATVGVALTWPADLAAQRSGRGGGDAFWFGAGLGNGWVRVSCDICRSDRGSALSGYLRLGGHVHPRLLIGAEGTGWMKGGGSVDERLWGISAVVYWYPNPRRALFWKGGAGLLSHRVEDGSDVLSSSAFGLLLGAGYDAPLAGRLSLTPYVNLFVASPGGEVKFNGARVLEHVSLAFLQLGLGLTRR